MQKIVRIGLGMTLAFAMSSSSVFAQMTIQPVPNRPGPGQPGRPSIQPVPKPQPVRPVRPQPPRPRPPHHDLAWIWLHQFRPPHHIGWNQALLFSGPYGSGSYTVVRQSIADLKSIGFNDRARSIYTTGTWMVCTRTNYRGSCATYRGRQGELGHLGGNISSIRFMAR